MTASVSRLVLATGAVLALGACERERIEVYTAPKDMPVAAAAEQHSPDDGHDHSHDGHAHASDPHASARPQLPKLSWTLPAGWQEAPAGQMSAATFLIKSDQGEANVTITPLPNLAGKEELVVNMWRQQVGQEPLSSEDVKKALTDIEVAGGKGQFFEITGNSGGKPTRIITAMRHGVSDASWFYKLSGDEALVNAQKPAFLEFVKSVRFHESAPAQQEAAQPQTTSAPAAASASTQQMPTAEPPSEFKWTVPQGWQTLQAGQMQVAKFAVPEQNGAKAEVSVSIFPNDTGGTLANVNRWLGQIGQQPVEETRLGEFVKPLEGAPEGALLVDLPGEPKRIVGAIVPREGRYWFYKMMGDAAAVTAAKDAFVAFSKAQP